MKQTVNRNDSSELDAVFNAIKEEQDAVCCEGHVHHGQQPGSGDSRGIADDRDHSMTIVKYHILTATREKLFLDEFWFSRMWAATVIEILFLFLTLYS